MSFCGFTDPLEFPEVPFPFETVRKPQVKAQEKDKESSRKIFSGPKKVSFIQSLFLYTFFPSFS